MWPTQPTMLQTFTKNIAQMEDVVLDDLCGLAIFVACRGAGLACGIDGGHWLSSSICHQWTSCAWSKLKTRVNFKKLSWHGCTGCTILPLKLARNCKQSWYFLLRLVWCSSSCLFFLVQFVPFSSLSKPEVTLAWLGSEDHPELDDTWWNAIQISL